MEKKLIYPTRGVCSQAIEISLEDDVVNSVQFYGGCNGKGTSCPDQLARALRQMLDK